MWLAISSIVLASAIGFNILALLLTGVVREVSGDSRPAQSGTTKADLNADWASHIVR
jgi:hypothetical protein